MREQPTFIHSLLRRARKASRRTRPGFSLLEIMIVIAISSVLLSIAFPNFVRARTTTRSRVCVKQIRTLSTVKEHYALLRKVPSGGVVSMGDLVADELISSAPTCPDGFPYTLGVISEETICTSGLPGHDFTGP